MPFTSNSDLYAAVHEDGINLIALHVMRQRPSLFNYATAAIANDPELACSPVQRTPDVDKYNPTRLFTVENPIPILGADAPPVGLNYAVQIVDAKLDFYPENVVTLPKELNPPLQNQHFSAMVRICGGIDCPGLDFLAQIPPGSVLNLSSTSDNQQQIQPIVPRPRKLQCFCLDAFLVGHLQLLTANNQHVLTGIVDAVDIVDIKPDALEDNINCYLLTTFSVLLREKLTIQLDTLFLGLDKYLQNSLVNVSFVIPPNPPIPNNPAIEDNQLKAFLDLKVGP
jgi:hypothetical protein